MNFRAGALIIFLFGLTVLSIYALSRSDHSSAPFDDLTHCLVKSSADSTIYLFDKDIDLNGKTIRLPSNTVLNFRNGHLKNGHIIGDSTEIIYVKGPIFDSIVIGGSWKIKEISTDLFTRTDTNTAANITALSSDSQFNRIVINHELKVPIKKWSSNLTIKSNTLVELNADLFTLPTAHKGGYCINIVGHDVKVNGNGHFLFGTIASSDQKECPQWLHGLNIDTESRNVSINDLNSWLFCGDGFYNAGSDVTLDRVNAKFNGRQGLSITYGSNIKVLNSSFTYTGFYRINNSGGPCAGIDIEPNGDEKVNNVLIEGCTLLHNIIRKGYINDLDIYNSYDTDLKVIDCSIEGIRMGSCSGILIEKCRDVKTIVGTDRNLSDYRFIDLGNPEIILKK